MPDYKNDINYMNLVNHIFDNEEFMKLDDIKHHNSTRLNHCIKVSYYSYKVAKKLGLNYEEVARAGLLHDFYLGQVSEQKKIKDKFLLFTTRHPEQAVQNSLKYFNLNEREQDIIRTHMFPIDIKIPKYAESWVVSLVDKYVSAKEFGYKFSSRLSWAANLYILMILRNLR